MTKGLEFCALQGKWWTWRACNNVQCCHPDQEQRGPRLSTVEGCHVVRLRPLRGNRGCRWPQTSEVRQQRGVLWRGGMGGGQQGPSAEGSKAHDFKLCGSWDQGQKGDPDKVTGATLQEMGHSCSRCGPPLQSVDNVAGSHSHPCPSPG